MNASPNTALQSIDQSEIKECWIVPERQSTICNILKFWKQSAYFKTIKISIVIVAITGVTVP